MTFLSELWLAVVDFLASGGGVLVWIALLTFVMWTLIAERFLYMKRVHPRVAAELRARWAARVDTTSWHAARIREQWISEARCALRGSIPMIRALVSLCPLLGLLGTVTGMMEVFDVMSLGSGGSIRAMASGVSKATIPTLAGMVAALSGVFFGVAMERSVREESERLADSLAHREGDESPSEGA